MLEGEKTNPAIWAPGEVELVVQPIKATCIWSVFGLEFLRMDRIEPEKIRKYACGQAIT